MPQAQQQLTPADVNEIARRALRSVSQRMKQQIFSQNGLQNQNQITVKANNVGLITGYWVNVVLTITNGSAVQINRTDFGPANALSNIQMNDMQNVQRINVPGWYMHFLNSAKMGRAFGSAMVRTTGFDSPIAYDAQAINQISAPATIAPAGTGTVNMWYYVPCAYSRDDLRGCIYGNVVNATMQLTLALPGSNGVSVAVQNGLDSTLAMYIGNVAGAVALATITAATVTVFQEYFALFLAIFEDDPGGFQPHIQQLDDVGELHLLQAP